VLLIIGILLLAFGISDLVVATLLARREAASTGGLGAETPVAARILRLTGMASVAAGAVLTVIGLVS
jgi:hypothetical protein